MSAFPLPVQAQPFALSGSGAIAGATSITLKSFKQIDGTTTLLLADFGTKGYGTLEPGNGTLEEQISFTGVTQNADGTATLTGIHSVGFVTPFTETSGLAQTHAGSVPFILSNDSGFYGAIKTYIDDAIIAGGVPATTTTLGISKASVAPADAANPIFVGDNDTRLSYYAADTGAANAYVITPSPAQTAYTTGQILSFKAGHANTGASTLNVNSLGVKTIKRLGGTDSLVTGDILAGQIVVVEYDGTNFQLISPIVVTNSLSYNVQTFSASGTWTKPANAKMVVVLGIGAGGKGGSNNGNANASSAGGGGGGAVNGLALSPAVCTATVAVTLGDGTVSATASTFGSLFSVAGGVVGGQPSGVTGGSGGAGGAAGTNGTAGGTGGAGVSNTGGFGGGGGGGGGSNGTAGSGGGAGGAAGTADSNLGAGGAGGPGGSVGGASQGSPGANYGGGGGGAGYGQATTSAGGNGGPGFMSVVTFF